jgi:hypothetical protein
MHQGAPPRPGACDAEHILLGIDEKLVARSVAENIASFDRGSMRVKELLAAHPTLAKASFDWGYGDWETALGAASHIGNRAIAELLIEHGAGPTIFSAAMLGQLDVVEAFAASIPNVNHQRGPHGIPLINHARARRAEGRIVPEPASLSRQRDGRCRARQRRAGGGGGQGAASGAWAPADWRKA